MAPTPRPVYLRLRESTYMIRPKIVENQFLLSESWAFRLQCRNLWVRDIVGWISLRLCPHLILPPYDRPFLTSYPMGPLGLEGGIATVLGGMERKEVHSGCTSCQTDFCITWDPIRSVMYLASWRNLGSFGSPQDQPWVAQIQDWGNDEFVGPQLDREMGSVRALYMQSQRPDDGSLKEV